MSERDAAGTDDSESESTDGSAGQDREEGAPEESVEEFAERPDGDPEDALAEILGSDAGGGSDRELPSVEDVDVAEDLTDRVRESSPESTARGIALLRARVEALESQLETTESELADVESRLKRKQADFQNYKTRQKERIEEEKDRATEDLVTRLLDVRDNLQRALDQDEDVDIRGGVESTLEQFDEELDRENVSPIEPEPGEDLDPQRHEALATVASDQPEDTIAQRHRPGYEMAGKVLRPAQVAVSDGSNHDGAE